MARQSRLRKDKLNDGNYCRPMNASERNARDHFIDWILSLDTVREDRFQMGDVVVTEDKNWRAEIETHELLNGIYFYTVRSDVFQDFELLTNNQATKGRFTTRFSEHGEYKLSIPGVPLLPVNTSQGLMFSPKDSPTNSVLRGHTKINVLAFSASLDALADTLESDPPPQVKAILEEDHNQDCVQLIPVSREMHQLIGYAHNSELLGGLRHLQLEGIAFQLLALQLHALTKAVRRAQPLQLGSNMPIEDVHQMLLSNLNNPPTLSELAKAAGVSPRHLNSLLKKAYGATAFELLRNERLDVAREILESEDVLLKQVSYRVGYKHVTNFIRAFTLRFGAPPRRHREQLEGDV